MPEGYNEVSKCVSISSNVSFLEGQQGASHDVCVCVSGPRVYLKRPVGEQIGQPVCDFAPGWDRAKERPVFMCVCALSI